MAPNIRSMHDLRKLEDSRDSINKEQVQKYEQVMKLPKVYGQKLESV